MSSRSSSPSSPSSPACSYPSSHYVSFGSKRNANRRRRAAEEECQKEKHIEEIRREAERAKAEAERKKELSTRPARMTYELLDRASLPALARGRRLHTRFRSKTVKTRRKTSRKRHRRRH
jgi:hypothetical protein